MSEGIYLAPDAAEYVASEDAYHLGYFAAIDMVAKKILADYMGHFPDIAVDIVLKRLRDELIEKLK